MNESDVDSMNSIILPNMNSTLSSSNDLTFQDVITNPFFYGSSIIFIFLFLCIISIVIFIKNKPKLLFSSHI